MFHTLVAATIDQYIIELAAELAEDPNKN